MIDLSIMSPEQIAALRATGYLDRCKPWDQLPEKPKRKQQGRGENQLEQDFREYCSGLTNGAEIWQFWRKPFILRIGPDMTFEPDFLVRDWTNQCYAIDTKGPFSREDSRIKIKVAAEKYPLWRWLIVTRTNGIWRAKEVKAEKGISRRFLELPWLR